MRPTVLISGTSEPERGIRANSASFRTTINCDAITIGPQANTTTSVVDANAWVTKLNEIAYNVVHAGHSKGQVRNKSVTRLPNHHDR